MGQPRNGHGERGGVAPGGPGLASGVHRVKEVAGAVGGGQAQEGAQLPGPGDEENYFCMPINFPKKEQLSGKAFCFTKIG